MGKANFTEDFTRDAVVQINERAIRLRRWRRGWGSANTRSTSGGNGTASLPPWSAMTIRPLRSAG